jgi:hypothetical protein
MSTHAQMTTIATYRIALLNKPPLARRDQAKGSAGAALGAGTLLPWSVLT